MRIRLIRKPRKGCIDGVDLNRFDVGQTYEVGNAIGALFLSENWAEPVASDEPAVVIPLSELPARHRRRNANADDSADVRPRRKRSV